MNQPETVLWFDTLDLSCLPQVGGKNASLGEMYQRLSEEAVSYTHLTLPTSDLV